MESALAAGIVRIGSEKNMVGSNDSVMVVSDVPHKTFDHPLPPNANQKSVNISTPPPTHRNLAQKFASQLNLPPTPGNKSAKKSSITKDEVGRWH